MSDHKYVAFDVHKSTITAVVLNLEGKMVTQAVIETDANCVRDFLRGLSGEVHLTFEEGTHAQWLYELTRRLVSHLTVCNARRLNSKGNNSDRIDALKLAQLLRAGLLPFHRTTACTGARKARFVWFHELPRAPGDAKR